MEISSRHVGLKSRPMNLEVTPRDIMNYAAGVSDSNSCYFNDETPPGIVAPPMLAVALTWQISARFRDYWLIDGFPYEVMAQQVHYSEILQWRRPMQPGDKLTIQGEVKAILPHLAGAHLIIEYRACDDRGEDVFVEQIGGLLRGVKCVDGGLGKDDVILPCRHKTDSPALWERVIPISPLAGHLYDGCANIHFPIHTSVAFARSVGLPDIIYHGTATLSLALREIVDREMEGDPRRLREVRCSFTGMVFPGTAITIQALGAERDGNVRKLHFAVLNAENKAAIRNACVFID